jgi:hypothetical protein
LQKEHQNYELRRAAPPAALPSLAAAAPRAACFTPAPQPTTADAPVRAVLRRTSPPDPGGEGSLETAASKADRRKLGLGIDVSAGWARPRSDGLCGGDALLP